MHVVMREDSLFSLLDDGRMTRPSVSLGRGFAAQRSHPGRKSHKTAHFSDAATKTAHLPNSIRSSLATRF